MKLLVLDSHTIYARGLVASLELIDDVESVVHAESVHAAWGDDALIESDLVILDPVIPGGRTFIATVLSTTRAKVLACSADCSLESVLAAVHAGAIGYLRKDTLTTEALTAAIQAAASGATGVVASDVLNELARSLAPHDEESERRPPTRLTEREHQVLTLIAGGHATREVAEAMCYSERTVKNVLHDAVTKLNARSRSQAVAFAVREGLI